MERSWCKGCGICVAFCPKQVLELDAEGKVSRSPPPGLHLLPDVRTSVSDLAIEVICDETGMGDGHE
ncbi:MAG: 4Fe-4S binding protein [Desulfobacterales bacterium]